MLDPNKREFLPTTKKRNHPVEHISEGRLKRMSLKGDVSLIWLFSYIYRNQAKNRMVNRLIAYLSSSCSAFKPIASMATTHIKTTGANI